MPWSSRFPDPIPLPDGGHLDTLQDAGTYITELPKQTLDARLGKALCTFSSRQPIMAAQLSLPVSACCKHSFQRERRFTTLSTRIRCGADRGHGHD
jgi:hypothetical protein